MKQFYLLFMTVLLLTGCSLFKSSSDDIPKPQMVTIPGGTFTMGDIYEGEKNTDAIPTHEVTLPNFRIGKYEVTYRQYDHFAEQTGRRLPSSDSLGRGDRAVVNVSWINARAFCEYYGWQLPTEQQWEYAARSGGQRMQFAGTNNVDSLDLYARTTNSSAPYSYKVGSRKPNQLGLYDMSGNVFEWIGRYYQFYPENNTKPEWDNLQERSIRIVRGGSFGYGGEILSTYWRVGMFKEVESGDVGFRCVDPITKNK